MMQQLGISKNQLELRIKSDDQIAIIRESIETVRSRDAISFYSAVIKQGFQLEKLEQFFSRKELFLWRISSLSQSLTRRNANEGEATCHLLNFAFGRICSNLLESTEESQLT